VAGTEEPGWMTYYQVETDREISLVFASIDVKHLGETSVVPFGGDEGSVKVMASRRHDNSYR
jgi:hypothetical protein